MNRIARNKIIFSLPLPWHLLEKENILITGASGLIGSTLVKTLLSKPNCNYTIYAMSRDIKKLQQIFTDYSSPNLVLIEGDVTADLNLTEDFKYIIDCASNANPQLFHNYPVNTILGNIYGVNNLLGYGVKHGLSRFLYVSSGEVYGEGTKDSFTEKDSEYIDSLNPRGCYPISKRAAENLCIAYAKEYNVDIVIARPCHIYGPNFQKSDDRAYAQFLRNAVKGEDIILNSQGLLNRSWCYVDDCVLGLIYILLKGTPNEAYNISDSPMTIRRLAELIAELSGVNISFRIKEDKIHPIISKGILDSTKLKSLGWKPLENVYENISTTLNELRNEIRQ